MKKGNAWDRGRFLAVPFSAVGNVGLATSLVNKIDKVRVQAGVKPLFS